MQIRDGLHMIPTHTRAMNHRYSNLNRNRNPAPNPWAVLAGVQINNTIFISRPVVLLSTCLGLQASLRNNLTLLKQVNKSPPSFLVSEYIVVRAPRAVLACPFEGWVLPMGWVGTTTGLGGMVHTRA
jgi:hypothetical protein